MKRHALLLLLLGGCHNAYKDAVTDAIRAGHRDALYQCGRELEQRLPNQHGSVTVAVEIQPDGHISRTGFGKQDAVKESAFRECIRQQASGWQMPPPTSGQTELVEYQFKL